MPLPENSGAAQEVPKGRVQVLSICSEGVLFLNKEKGLERASQQGRCATP